MLFTNLLIFVVVQVMGNAHLYPECETENHRLLKEPGRKHEYDQPSRLQDWNLTTDWYRVYEQAGKRLLDITDIPKHFFERNTVRLVFWQSWRNLIILQNLSFENLLGVDSVDINDSNTGKYGLQRLLVRTRLTSKNLRNFLAVY